MQQQRPQQQQQNSLLSPSDEMHPRTVVIAMCHTTPLPRYMVEVQLRPFARGTGETRGGAEICAIDSVYIWYI